MFTAGPVDQVADAIEVFLKLFDSDIDVKRWIVKFFGPLDLTTSELFASKYDSIISTIDATTEIDYRRLFGVNAFSPDFEVWSW